ncbi:MAG TPA: hypothetical protein VFQ41_01625 [Candidatus Angelobacter sp.]|nr:hypothetical protein [Candidatus Angelobacter sp.]
MDFDDWAAAVSVAGRAFQLQVQYDRACPVAVFVTQRHLCQGQIRGANCLLHADRNERFLRQENPIRHDWKSGMPFAVQPEQSQVPLFIHRFNFSFNGVGGCDHEDRIFLV